MSPNIKNLENRLWEAADHMRANSPLRLNEFAEPVLGLIFLKFAGVKHVKAAEEIAEKRKGKSKKLGGASVSRERPVSSADYHARGVLFVPEKARFSYLIELPEGTDMGKAVNDAMKAIEEENKELAGILPKTFQKLDNRSIIALLKNFNQIPDDIEGDAFGRIYEYFLGKFALADGSRGGEFFTPTSIVKLIVEIITGTTPSTKNGKYWNGEFLWATPTDIKEDTFILADTPKKLSRSGYEETRPVPKNAILVTCIASIGKMAIAGKEMATNQQINSIVCNKENNPFFVFFSLQKIKNKLIRLGKTTAVPIINKSESSRIKIPLPPLDIQKQIVAKLSAVQDYKTQLLAQKSKLKELFDSALAKSFN